MKHGTNARPLTALYFNDDEFRLSNIFSDCYVPINTKNYSPYMRILRIKPRADYTEHGTHFGLTVEGPLPNTQTRVGIHVNIPLKHVEIEREDKGSKDTQQTQNVIRKKVSEVSYNAGTVDTAEAVIRTVHAIRLDFVEALPKNTNDDPAIDFGTTSTKVFDREISKDTGDHIAGAVVYSPEGYVPQGKIDVKETSKGLTGSEVGAYLPVSLDQLHEGVFYEFNTTDYSSISDEKAIDADTRIALQDKKANLWFVPTFENSTGSSMNAKASSIKNAVRETIQNFHENTYEWFHDRGFNFETTHCAGMGDISIDAFIEHNFLPEAVGRFSLGTVLPTAAGTTNTSNPYNIHLGNRGHIEYFMGSNLSWDIANTIANITVDTKYSWTMTGSEERVAPGFGSKVKNIGPSMLADTHWSTFNGDLSLNIVNQESHNILFSVAYNLYYKSEDSVVFHKDYIQSWLGAYTNGSDNSYKIHHGLAAKNTEQIGHRFRYGMLYFPSEWIQFQAGGMYSIGGKNMPVIIEHSASITMKF